MRIAHLPVNPANQAWTLAKAQRRLGHEATVFSRDNPWKFSRDIVLPDTRGPFQVNVGLLQLWKQLQDFDVLHVHGGIRRGSVFYPLFKKMSGRELVIHYHGSETRNGTGLYWQNTADALFYTPPDIKFYLPERARWLPQAVDMDGALHAPEPRPVNSKRRPVIVHFSTNEANKGTTNVVRLFEETFPESFGEHGPDCSCYHGGDGSAVLWVFRKPLDRTRALSIMQNADIIIDQVTSFGIYGAVAAEAMALGRPVMASSNQGFYGRDCPVFWPSPTMLEKLVRDSDLRFRASLEGMEYAKRVHDPLVVAQRALDAY